MAIVLIGWLSFVVGACIGLRAGSPCIVQRPRITRLVLIRGRTKTPRMAWVDSEHGLDDLEDALVAAFCRGRLVPAELQAYDDVRRLIAERRAA